MHSPGTKKNDAYRSTSGDEWAEYCEILEESDVEAFGITDYFSADGFFNTRSEIQSRYKHSRKLLLPNIELCLDTVANKNNDYVNIHLVFNPATPDVQLKKFLSKLKTNRTIDSRTIFASELSTEVDFNEATTTPQHIKTAIEETFGTENQLDHLLIIPAVNNDGIRPASGVARREAVSRELDKFSDAFFGNSKNVNYYEQTDRWGPDEISPPKSVLAGSDAHSFEDLRETLGKTVFRNGNIYKQTTWIKADVTFEGLRQIVFEPTGRVFVGEEPEVLRRLEIKPRRFIQSILIDRIDGYDGRFGMWFQGIEIPLNPELVAIIGNKGSGKSALTDILGLVGNSHKQKSAKSDRPEELFSFLNKDKFLKQNCASNFVATLKWQAGDPDTCALNTSTDCNRAENIEYLPQKYLEKICSNIEDNEFRAKLNEVIFGYVKQNDTYNKETLDELISYLSDQAREDIRQASAALNELNKEVVHLERKITAGYRREIQSQVEIAERDLAAHLDTRPPLVERPQAEDPQANSINKEISETESRSESLRNEHAKLTQEQAKLSKQAEDLEQAKRAIDRQVSELKALEQRYATLLTESGLRFADIVSVKFDSSRIDEIVDKARERLKEIKPQLATVDDMSSIELAGSDEVADAAKAVSIDWQLKRLTDRRAELVDGLNKPSRDYQVYLQKEQEWQDRQLQLEGAADAPAERTLNWLRQELTRINEVYPTELQKLRQAREGASKTIHGLKKRLLLFLNAVKESIDQEISSRSKELRDYNITIESGLKLDQNFSDDFLRFINSGKKGSFHGTEDGRAELQRLLEPITDWGNEQSVFSALNRIVDDLDFDNRHDSMNGQREKRDIFDQLKQGKDPAEFYNFIFGFSYLDPIYDLKVDGKSLSELSPGERGGVLLVFYLMLDKRDIPLVIDQPEDNLDNKSVFEVLVTFLKEAKKRRQIIIATHNPNLAVVADAEQIIHVEIDKKQAKNEYTFYSCAIENPKINRAVVDILEGTLPAFDNRRLKYRRQG